MRTVVNPRIVEAPQRRWFRIIPIAFIMYSISFVDRTNISLALPQISSALHLDHGQAGMIAGTFYWGYFILQIPCGYLAQRWSPKRLVSILLVTWGILAASCGLATGWGQLCFLRTLLGLAEGGVYPATVVLFTNWFPWKERARAIGFWSLCLPITVIMSAPLSGWLLDRWGWRTMLVAEGCLPILWLVIWIVGIEDSPREARWISSAEREYLESTLSDESSQLESKAGGGIRALFSSQIVLLLLIYFVIAGTQSGYLYWLPSALMGYGSRGSMSLGFLFTIPFVIAAVSIAVNSYHSDKLGERRMHVTAALGAGGVFIIAAVLSSYLNPAVAFAFLCVGVIGSYAPLGPFWAIPAETLPKRMSGAAIGLVNAVGNLGGYFGPVIVGNEFRRTGGFKTGFGLLGMAMLVGAASCLLIREGAGPPRIHFAAETQACPKKASPDSRDGTVAP